MKICINGHRESSIITIKAGGGRITMSKEGAERMVTALERVIDWLEQSDRTISLEIETWP